MALNYSSVGIPIERIDVPDAPSLDVGVTTPVTFCGWVNWPGIYGASTIATIFSKDPGNFTGLWWGILSIGPSDTLFYFTGAATVVDATPFPVGVDTHIATTYDGTTVIHYINGVPGPPTVSLTTQVDNAFDFSLADFPNFGGFFPYFGTMDDMRVYSRVLTPAEIQTIFQTRGIDNIVDGLNARWQMREQPTGSITTGIRDSGQFGNNSSLVVGGVDYVDSILRYKRLHR